MENSKLRKQQKEQQELSITEITQIALQELKAHWLSFVLSGIFCLAVGWLYQQRQTRVYQRQAVLLIDDAESANGPRVRSTRSAARNTMMELNGISAGDNLANQKYILQSFRLLRRVVDTLHLDVDYSMQQALHSVSLYSERPFEAEWVTPFTKTVSFEAEKLSNGRLRLSHFSDTESTDAEQMEIGMGQLAHTPVGDITFRTTEYFKDFPVNKPVQIVRRDIANTAAIFKSRVSVTDYDKESSLLVLSCTDASAQRAEDILNEIVQAYKREVVENKNRVAENTARFVNSRLELIGAELSGVEEELVAFKQENGLVDFTQTAHSAMAESTKAREASLHLETELSVVKYLKDFVSAHGHDHDLIPVLNLSDNGINGQISQYNTKMLEREHMSANTTDDHALMRQFDADLAASRKAIVSSLDGLMGALKLRLQDARANEANIGGLIAGAPVWERRGLDIKRQQALKETIYTYLLNKREEVAMQLSINEANVRLVEDPLGSDAPVAPRKDRILLVSLLIGLLIPAIFIWIRRQMAVTLHNRKDVTAITDAPIVGELLHNEAFARGEVSSVQELPAESPLAESFRLLRHNIAFMRPWAKVLMTTSVSPGHGKTFVARGLAAILAKGGRRVLLIDADIRKRTLSHGLRMPFGLSTLLAEQDPDVNLSEFIVHDKLEEGVDFLPAGPVSPNPGELLMSKRFDEIIKKLREQYDYIILDTTPYFAVVDASIVNHLTDMTLFIMRAKLQERSFIYDIDKMYREKSIRDLCLVLNDVNSQAAYGYGYGYGYVANEKRRGFRRFLKF